MLRVPTPIALPKKPPQNARYLGPVATAAMIPNQLSSTASASMMMRKAHYARNDIQSLQLAYATWYVNILNNGLGAETGMGNTVSVTAWIEYPIGTYTQLKWSGANSGTLADFTNTLTDSLAINIPNGGLFLTWTLVTGGGNNFPYILRIPAGDPLYYNGTPAEACNYGTSGVPTTPGTITDNDSGKRGYWPCAILGTTVKDTFYLLGDSRNSGDQDKADSTYDLGDMVRSVGPYYAYINGGVGGDKIAGFCYSSTQRMALSQYCTVVMEELAVNDLIESGQFGHGRHCVQADDRREILGKTILACYHRALLLFQRQFHNAGQ